MSQSTEARGFDEHPYISEDRQTVHAELWYPRNGDNPTEIRVGLMDVRAADDIVIRYDFDRDGWVVLQDETEWRDERIERLRELVEVAFIPAWNMPADRSES
jgi:hypothetical protein